MATSTAAGAAAAARNANIDLRPDAARTASIDSTSSSSNSGSTNVARPNAISMYRPTDASAAPLDVASLVASAGSTEAAIKKLYHEKISAASHNAQLWRLVEKQRSMIMDLNKDLEKSLKDKERYRKKLKEHLVSSSSAPSLTSSRQSTDLFAAIDRKQSESPALGEPARIVAHPVVRDASLDSRKVSDASAASAGPRRSDTPQDAMNMSAGGSATKASATPLSPGLQNMVSAHHDLQRLNELGSYSPELAGPPANMSTTPPLSPGRDADVETNTPRQTMMNRVAATDVAASPPASATSLGGFKNATRKAPPAPLDLSPRPIQPLISNAFADASESEYEDDPDSARFEQMLRGRRKTREEDDREREVLARQAEEEARSRSTKKEKSKSKSQHRNEEGTIQPEDFPLHKSMAPPLADPAPQPQQQRQLPDMSQPSTMLREKAANLPNILSRNANAPSLMSPGLPMSPRPGDRPMNSPLPRPMNNKPTNSIPMSPGVGMPLSPRPPKQPIPLPAQTPLTFASPHLARAEQYHQQGLTSPISGLRPDSDATDASSPSVSSPANVYQGLVTEQYPDLLLPPNALPSIIVKAASSRMRPSRQSFIAPKQEENPVFIVGVYQRADGRQLWRSEKTLQSLAGLDYAVKSSGSFRDKLPDKSLFAGHAPAKIDARRAALDQYFERMLDSIREEKTAKIVCKFLSTDTLPAESGEMFPSINEPAPGSPATPPMSRRPRREGYLTKRGKNFGGWKARYFVLDGPTLKYFEAPGGAQLGLIKLQSAQIGKQAPASNQNQNDDEENQFRHAFLILEPKRKDSSSLVRHVLCAESDEERDLWVDALLQYVDYRDEGEQMGGGVSIVNGPRSPRLQKSMGELRPSSQNDTNQLRPGDALRYDQMVAGEAPQIGGTNGRSTATPPPRQIDENQSHPQISGPSNAHPIQNAENWGMKSPPTPGQTQKDKKRGLFNFRGRSSSDLAPTISTPGLVADGTGFPRSAFGMPLAEAVSFSSGANANTGLPIVVYRCLEYLNDNDAVSEEGIFRLSGSNTVIKGLRERFNNEGDVNLVGEGKYYDIHAVASLLKLYLRELPASILTRELHLDFLKCLDLSEEDKIAALNVMVNKLPTPNRILLSTLAEFLLSIVSNAEVNKMNIRNGELTPW